MVGVMRRIMRSAAISVLSGALLVAIDHVHVVPTFLQITDNGRVGGGGGSGISDGCVRW